jgi:hypothetical protein
MSSDPDRLFPGGDVRRGSKRDRRTLIAGIVVAQVAFGACATEVPR